MSGTASPMTRTPSPAPALDIFDSFQFIEEATDNYTSVNEESVCIRIKDQTFRVSKSRLILRSPVFRDMLTLPPGEEKDVQLHSDPEEFRDFLWFIHADPLAADKFRRSVATPRKCSALLGIASAAHAYEASDVAAWAMRGALEILMDYQRPFSLDAPIAEQLLRTAARFQEWDTFSFLASARDVVCDAIHPKRPGVLSRDPIVAVLAAQAVEDPYGLAHAYFYALEMGNDYWRTDRRLYAEDRRRLMCGGFLIAQRRLSHPNYTYYGRSSEWQPVVHQYIQDWRDELSAVFDCDPWHLVEEA